MARFHPQLHAEEPGPTVAEVVARWLEDIWMRVDLARGTQVEYTRISRHLVGWAADQRLAELNLAPFVLARRDAEAAPRTIRLELRVTALMFQWAKDAGYLPPGATLRLPRIKIDPNRFVVNHRTPTPGEASLALAAMDDDDWKLAALLLARTGARIGEVVALRSCDLDLHSGRLALGAVDGASKTGVRWFPLDDASLAALSGRAGRGKEELFDYQVSAPIKGLQRRLREACDRAGVARFTPHGLRRMVVGRLLRARVDPGTAAALTGHSVQVMLRFYQEVTDEDRREAAERANLGELGPIGHHAEVGPEAHEPVRAAPACIADSVPLPPPAGPPHAGSLRLPARTGKRLRLKIVRSSRVSPDGFPTVQMTSRALPSRDPLQTPSHRRPP